MMKYIIIFAALLLTAPSLAQLGGKYNLLNLDASARETALGSHLITVQDDDVALAYANPAALNPRMQQQIYFGNQFYFAKTGINHGYLGYGFKIPTLNYWMFHGGIQYINYGKFDQRDVYANSQGTVKASEYALTGGASRLLTDKLTLGANLKFVISQLGGYNSLSMATDIATMYHDTASLFSASLVVRNLGTQLTSYHETREKIPFEIQAGFSKKLKHLPLRFSVIATNLQRWDIRYDDPNAVENTGIFGNAPKEKTKTAIFVDNFFRHLVFNGEFLFGKKENFRLRVGYNHLRRAELSLKNLRSLAGFSGGVGFKIKQFKVDYGISFYHLGANTHHIGISTNFNRFKR